MGVVPGRRMANEVIMIYLCSVYTAEGADAALMLKRYEYAMKRTAQYLANKICVFSPIVHCHELALRHDLPKSFAWWESLDRCYIDASDMIHVLKMPMWEKSEGIQSEIWYARLVGKEIIYVDCEDYSE